MKRLLQALTLSSALVAGSAFAHAELSQSVPADQAALDAAPKEVILHFSEAVRLTALSLKKEGGAASNLGPLPTGTNQHFALPAGDLTAGAYTVEWRALGDDGHALRGTLRFTVGMPAAAGRNTGGAGAADHAQHGEHSDHSQPH